MPAAQKNFVTDTVTDYTRTFTIETSYMTSPKVLKISHLIRNYKTEELIAQEF